jgi:hypothetical protein
MMGKSVFFSEGTAGQMKSAPSFAKDDDSTLPKEPNGSKIGLGPKPIWGMSVESCGMNSLTVARCGAHHLDSAAGGSAGSSPSSRDRLISTMAGGTSPL